MNTYDELTVPVLRASEGWGKSVLKCGGCRTVLWYKDPEHTGVLLYRCDVCPWELSYVRAGELGLLAA